LDEIGELPTSLQVKLLRFLQEEEIRRIGDTKDRSVDVRVIAATAVDLAEATTVGAFREDLYYRLNVLQISIPPLRERKEDIPLLVEHFISHFSQRLNREVHGFTRQAMRALMDYHWPGNVRELENAIERAVVMGDGKKIVVDDLPIGKTDLGFQEGIEVGMKLKEAQDVFKKEFLKKTLAYTHGSQKKAAEILGIQRTYLSRLISEYNLRF